MTLLDALDLAGVVAFAVSGCAVALRRRMDLVGVVVLGIVTGLAGGVTRDVLLGDVPPLALQQGRYLLAAVMTGAVVIVAGLPLVERIRQPVEVFDAVGLGLFAAVGAQRATAAGVGLGGAVALGVISAIGGGLLRDILSNEDPQIFGAGSRLYAIPAALGAGVAALAERSGWAEEPSLIAAVLVTTLLRLGALRFGWHAPVPRRGR